MTKAHFKPNTPFPKITKLWDVIGAIAGRKEFVVARRDWFTSVLYVAQSSTTFGGLPSDDFDLVQRLRECRGLVFDSSTGDILARPYHKFFNVNEKPDTELQHVDLGQPHVILEKLDGSMVFAVPAPGGFRLFTKAGITETSMRAEELVAASPRHSELIKCFLRNNATPIFEWCSRRDSIVLDYPEDELVLTAARWIDTGEYIDYDKLREISLGYRVPLVRTANILPGTPTEQILELVRGWDDAEGIVIRFPGDMLKIKADDYVFRHRAISGIRTDRALLELVAEDRLDDLLPLMPVSRREYAEAYRSKVAEGLFNAVAMLRSLDECYSGVPRERLAAALRNDGFSRQAPALFSMRDGVSPEEWVSQALGKAWRSNSAMGCYSWLIEAPESSR